MWWIKRELSWLRAVLRYLRGDRHFVTQVTVRRAWRALDDLTYGARDDD